MSLKSLFANIVGFLGLSIVLIAAQIYLFGNNQQQSSLNHHDSTPGRLLSEDNGGFLDLLISSSAPGTPSLASLTRANKYISYMEIPLPPRLFKMARNQGRSPITLQFGMKAPESMYESERILDAFSSNQDVSSNFLINFWGPTITFIVVILLAVVFNLLHRLAYKKQWDTAYSLFGILKKIFQWNFVLILIATSAEDVFYYAALQFKGMDAGSGAAIFGILECFVMMIVVIAFLVGIFVLIQKQRYTKKFVQSHEASDTYADFLDKYQSLQILNTGFKDENLSTHLFYLIYIAKNVLSAILGGFLDIAPIVQIILQVLLNSLMLTYVLCLQPLKKSINMIQLILIEGISLFTNFAMVAAVEEGAKNEQDTDTGSSVGDFVIVGNVLINILIIYFLIHKIVVEGKAIYRLQKSQVKMSKLTWLRILPIILQQGGLGFENIELPVISLNDIKNKRFTPLSNASRSEITKVGEEPESPLRRLNVTGHTESAFTFPALHNSPDYIRDSQFSDTSAGSPVHPFKSIGSPDSPLPLFKVQSYNLSEQVAEALEDQKVVEIGLSQNTIELMRARLTEKNKYAKVKRALVNVHKKKLGSSTILKALEAKPLLQLNLKNKSIEQAKPQNGAPLIQIKSSKNPENMPSVALKQKEAVEEDIEPQNEIQNEVGPQAPTDKELFNDIEQGLMELDEAQNLAEKEEVERAEAREGRVREKDENIQNFQHTDDDFDVMAEIEVNPSDENKDAGVYQNQENQYEHQADQQNDASEPLFKVEPEQEQERERSEQRNGNGNGSFNEDQQQPISATFRNIEEPNKTQSNFEKLTLNEEDMAAGPQSREDIDAEDNEQDENKRSKSLSKSPTNRRARLRGNKQESPKVPSQMKRLEASPFKSNPGKRR